MSLEFPEPFRPEDEEGNTGWENVPAGEYVAQVIEAQVRPPRTNDGYGLNLVWKILEGDCEGRQIWQWITFQHSSQMAQGIGRKMIKDACTAFDISEHLENAEPLLFKPARIRVGIEPGQDGLDRNKVKRILPLAAEKPTTTKEEPETKPAPRTQGPSRPGPVGTAPWHTKR
jgi:hypothetical protein